MKPPDPEFELLCVLAKLAADLACCISIIDPRFNFSAFLIHDPPYYEDFGIPLFDPLSV